MKLSDEFVTWVKNPIKPTEIAGMPKPMHSNIFAAVETFKCPFDNSLSDSDPNTMLISNETKWGRALYKPFCFDKIIAKMVFCYQNCSELPWKKNCIVQQVPFCDGISVQLSELHFTEVTSYKIHALVLKCAH